MVAEGQKKDIPIFIDLCGDSMECIGDENMEKSPDSRTTRLDDFRSQKPVNNALRRSAAEATAITEYVCS
nr:hypothetical protein [Salmonella sp.]